MARHQDSFVSHTERVPQGESQEFEAFNDQVTADSVLSRPAADSHTPAGKTPLLVSLAETNYEHLREIGRLNDTDPDQLFDGVVCDIAGYALSRVGFSPTERELEKYRALVLQVLRDLPTNQALADYIAGYTVQTRREFGLGDARGRSTYQKTARALTDAGRYDDLVQAAEITAYGVFGLGVPLPASTEARYNLSQQVGPAAAEYSARTRRSALYALVHDLMELVGEHFTFDRASNTSTTVESLLGVCAHSALLDVSVESYAESAQHLFGVEDAVSGTRTYELAGSLSLWEVNDVFDDITYALLDYASDTGAIPSKPIVSYDLTRLDGLHRSSLGRRFRTADGEWRFASLACTDSDLEFSLGMRLLKSEAQRASVLRRLLRKLTDTLDVQLLMLDRGFDGIADIEACREFVGDDWLIFAQNDEWTTGTTPDFTRLYEALSPGETAVVTPAGYDGLTPSTQLIGYSGSTDDDVAPIRAFYSDLQLPADEDARAALITRLNFVYNRRAKIESMFRLTKNRFALGSTTDDPVRTQFYYNIAVLFYNLYQLVNTVPTPVTGLELDVSQTELLTAVRNVAFDGPTQPIAMTFPHSR